MSVFTKVSLAVAVFLILIVVVVSIRFFNSFSDGCSTIKEILEDDAIVFSLSKWGSDYFSNESNVSFDQDVDLNALNFLGLSKEPEFVADKVYWKKNLVMIGLGLGYRNQIVLANDLFLDEILQKDLDALHHVEGNVFYSCMN